MKDSNKNLRGIRHQIHSIENVKKITKAMERVAAAKLKSAQMKAEQSRAYVAQLKSLLRKLSSANIDHPIFHKKRENKISLLIVAGDRGFSGSYNTHIFNQADHFLSQYSPDDVSLHLFGKKAFNHYKNEKYLIKGHHLEWTAQFNLKEKETFAHQLNSDHLTTDIWVIYTEYITVFKRKVNTQRLFDFETDDNEIKVNDYIYEPNPQKIIEAILPRYTLAIIQNILYEAHSAELAARVLAMEAATHNAEEMIENLNLIKNRIRQEGITREILDFISHV